MYTRFRDGRTDKGIPVYPPLCEWGYIKKKKRIFTWICFYPNQAYVFSLKLTHLLFKYMDWWKFSGVHNGRLNFLLRSRKWKQKWVIVYFRSMDLANMQWNVCWKSEESFSFDITSCCGSVTIFETKAK
jgi:hypothetical protein